MPNLSGHRPAIGVALEGAEGMQVTNDDFDKRVARLGQLSQNIAQMSTHELLSDLSMRVPADRDRDADLVIAWAAAELRRLRDALESTGDTRHKALEART